MPLPTQARISDPDGFYEALIHSQRDLSDHDAALMNAKLVLTLANHIGDREVLQQALNLCRSAHPPSELREKVESS
jgi:Protein of unknown function (DUF2783)